MNEFITNNFEHILCILLLIARVGDVLSTYLVTPSLKLEANPIVRKFRWPFAILTIFVCFIPYFSTVAGIIILVPSLLVCASNTSKIWFIRTYGEEEYLNLIFQLARKSKMSFAILCQLVSSFFIILSGLVLIMLSENPLENWGAIFGIGIITYGFVMALHGSLSIRRIFKQARGTSEQQSNETNIKNLTL